MLRGTPISDLEPLRGLTGLTRLDLTGTDVGRDQLSVLAGNPGLVPPESRNALAPWLGVRLADSKAAHEDAGIEADRERTLALFADLGIDPGTEGPEADPLLPVLIEGGKLEISASFPAVEEQEEWLKQVLHDRLKPKAADCAQKAGNEAPWLAGKARVLSGLLDRPFGELDLLVVHLEVEDIEAWALREPKQRNMLWRLASVAALAVAGLGGNVAANMIAAAYGPQITAIVGADWELLMKAAATYGVDFASSSGGRSAF